MLLFVEEDDELSEPLLEDELVESLFLDEVELEESLLLDEELEESLLLEEELEESLLLEDELVESLFEEVESLLLDEDPEVPLDVEEVPEEVVLLVVDEVGDDEELELPQPTTPKANIAAIVKTRPFLASEFVFFFVFLFSMIVSPFRSVFLLNLVIEKSSRFILKACLLSMVSLCYLFLIRF